MVKPVALYDSFTKKKKDLLIPGLNDLALFVQSQQLSYIS